VRAAKPARLYAASMSVLLSPTALEALIHPKFQAELPRELRGQIKAVVAQAKRGDGSIALRYNAGAVRDAAKRLSTKPGVPKKLAGALPELSRAPGY
jgi:hypothetical protein